MSLFSSLKLSDKPLTLIAKAHTEFIKRHFALNADNICKRNLCAIIERSCRRIVTEVELLSCMWKADKIKSLSKGFSVLLSRVYDQR